MTKRIGVYVGSSVLVCLGLSVAVRGQRSGQSPYAWVAAASMHSPRAGACSVALRDGRVLMSGGSNESGVLSTAEILDADGKFLSVTPMSTARAGHACAALEDGTVLVAGGDIGNGAATNTAEIYDPVAANWRNLSPAVSPRIGATASVLTDGRVLIAGGEAWGAALALLEIYDPASREFGSVPATLLYARKQHAATRLPDGRVLIAGGTDGSTVLDTIDIYDPATNAVSAAGKLSTRRASFSMTALQDGKLLIAGGSDGSIDLASAEIYDVSTGVSTPAGSMTTARKGHMAYLLPDNNQVLLVGGAAGGRPVAAADLYVPWQKAFISAGSLSTARNGATGAPMKGKGRLVVAGGMTGAGASATAEALNYATLTANALGQTTVIRGSGWVRGETVTLMLDSPRADGKSSWTLTADESGNISDSIDSQAAVDLTAVGSKSQAKVLLRDAGIARRYAATISPTTVAPGTTNTYTITVTNDLFSGQTNNIQFIKLTLPTGFTLVGANPVTVGTAGWSISISGQVISLSSPGDPSQVLPGQALSIMVTATAPNNPGATCDPSTFTYLWDLVVSQQDDTGSGNDFKPLTPPTNVYVPPPGCLVVTGLVLNSVSPNSVNAGSAGPVILTATLTRTDTNAAIANEPVNFIVGAEPACSATTTALGVASCSYNPHSLPYGTYAVQALFSGDGSATPLPYSTANSNTLSLDITPFTTSISVSPASGPYGGTVNLSATLTSNGSPLSGKQVDFSLNGTAAGSATTNASGVATLSASLGSINAGTYPTGVTASFPGDGVYVPTSGTAQLTVTQGIATITLGNLNQTYTGSPLSPSVTTTPAGIAFTLTGAPDTNAGSYPVTATISDPNYTGSASGTFVIAKAPATFTWSNLTQTYTGSPLSPTVATVPAGLSYTFTGAPDTAAGSYPVTATITDPNYTGSDSQTFTINKAPATVTFGNLTQAYTGSPLSPTVTTGPAGLSYTLTGAPDTAAGSYPVTATVTDPNYTGSAKDTFTITQAAATVTLGDLTQTYTGSPLSPSATTNPAGLAITWTGAPDTNAGSYPVTATISDPNYTGSASGTFTINKAPATVTFSNLTQTYTGSSLSPTVTTGPAGLNFTLTGAPDTNAGAYPVSATVNDNNYTGSASGTFTINKAPATVAFSNLTQTYTGSALSPTVTTTPSGLNFTLTGAPDTNAGSYPVTATVNDPNYTGSASGTFVIEKAPATVTLSNMEQTYTGSSLSPSASTNPAGLKIVWTGTPDTNAGSYPVTATVNDPNYAGSASGNFIIDPATPILIVTGGTYTYDGAAHPAKASMSPCSSGPIAISYAPGGSAAPVTVGAYTANASFAGNGNCNAVNGSAAITINQRPASVTPKAAGKIYGAVDPPLSGTLSGFIASDGVTATYSRTPGESIGTYTISATLSSAVPGALNNYSITYNTAIFTITRRPASVTPNAVSIYYGQPDPPLTGTLSGFLPGDNVTATYSRTPGTEPGRYAISVNQPLSSTGDLNNYLITYNTAAFTILKRPTQIVVTVVPNNGIYGSCYTAPPLLITATLMDVTPGAPPTALPGQQVTIGIGTQVAGQYLTDANGFVSGNITQLLQNVGQVPAFGNFAGTNHYAASSGNAPFTVYADPNVGGVNGPLYTGSQFFWTTSPSSSTATLALSATLQDTGGACHGNISTATVTFAIRLPGSTVYTPIPSAQNLPVGLVNPNDTTIGTATAIAQYNIGNNPGPVNVDIAIIVGGNYILNNPTTDSTITIAKPGAASAVTGSVWLNLASFGGYYASNGYLANNQPGALELNADVHYNKSGTNPQGSVNMTFTSYNNPDGSPASVPHTYYVKSTSVAELTFASLTQVSFSAKANIRDTTTGASVDSASTLQVTVTKDPNGVNPDMVSVSVQRKSGGLLISTCWDGAKTWQKPVDGPGRMSVTQ